MAHEPTAGARPHPLPTPGMPPRFARLRFMSADAGATGTPGTGATDAGQGGKGGYTPPATQADLDAIIGERVARERAKYADHDSLKAKAAELDTLKASKQTDAEKTADQIAKLQVQLAETQVAALRSRIQAKYQIADEDAALLLTGTDEDTLTKQAEVLAQRVADRKKAGGRDVFAGHTASTTSGSDPMREFTRGLFGRDN